MTKSESGTTQLDEALNRLAEAVDDYKKFVATSSATRNATEGARRAIKGLQ